MSLNINKLRSELLGWFIKNQRVLPWRGTKDPYKIWLSEVIMQQTRVVQGTPYYLRFIEKFPELPDLAAASEQEVLKLWQGLGYYSRGRNLLEAAKQIVSDYGGVFPTDYELMRKLKGIGPYTAAAIVSIAYNKPYAVLDGNVYRVLARVFGIEIPINANGAQVFFQEYADDLLDKKNPGMFNEAMMEFGGSICLPKNPICSSCPINNHCAAYKTGSQDRLPLKLAKKAVKTRYFHYLFIKDGNDFIMTERPEGDIWQGLYQFPMIETWHEYPVSINEVEAYLGTEVQLMKSIKKMRHKLTHQTLVIHFYETLTENFSLSGKKNLVLVNKESLKHYPLPKPIELFINN